MTQCEICGEDLEWDEETNSWVCPNDFDHGYGN